MSVGTGGQEPWTYRRTALATLTVLAVVAAFLALYFFRNVLVYLFAGIVLATALHPAVARLERWRLSRSQAVLLVFTAVGVIAFGLAIYVLPKIVSQAASLVETLPGLYDQLHERLVNSSSEVLSHLGESLPKHLGAGASGDEQQPQFDFLTVTEAVNWGVPIVRALFASWAVALLAFFWSIQEDRSIRAMLLWFPPPRRGEARDFFEAAQAKVGAFVRGQGILCATVGTMSWLAFMLIGLPNALALAVLAGVLESVPVFGPVLGAVPAILVAASMEPSPVLWVIVAAVAIQQTENYVLVPRVMSRAVGVNELVTLLAMAAFTALMGLSGAILAIPIAALIQLALERWVLESDADIVPSSTERGAIGRLQYRLRELLRDSRRLVRNKPEMMAVENDRIEEAIETIAQDLDDQLTATAAEAAPELPVVTATPESNEATMTVHAPPASEAPP
ncbi:MAG TPA: AI-2E family transporter [Pirellulales bacterium]|jgi:predicted PurR-regulated permease PerM|nr:AI-2E family transporter [Pirellulales bacterium]